MRILKLSILSMFILLGSFSGVYAEEINNPDIWIDVRTLAEFQGGHLQGAINISHLEIGERIDKITNNKEARLHLYCAAGVRAGIAKNVLEKMGYRNVVNEGGFYDLVREKRLR